MRNRTTARLVNYDCAGARKDQRERANKFCAVLLDTADSPDSALNAAMRK